MKLNELNRILLLIKSNNESWTIRGDCANLPVLLYDESLRQQGSDHSVGLLKGHVLIQVSIF